MPAAGERTPVAGGPSRGVRTRYARLEAAMNAMRDHRPDAPTVVLIMGPTASGKTRASLALAAHLHTEIVSVDSAQIYRGMDIGTAKPDAAERGGVPHHLIDIIDPDQRYSAARFAGDALATIHDIVGRGRIPILSGGTMLYFKALREGLSDLPEADPDMRAVIDGMARDIGWPALHQTLATLDPVSAARLDPNDSQRIQRALEVCWITGRPMTEVIADARRLPAPFRFVPVALVPADRSILHARIAARFETMLELGLVDEVRRLRAAFALKPTMTSMRCVGYRQTWDYLDGAFGLATLRDKAVAATRQLAKRQLTWLRSMPDALRLDCLDEALDSRVTELVEAHLP